MAESKVTDVSNGVAAGVALGTVENPIGGFKRVLSLWDLTLFGIAFVTPTAPYAMFGVASVKSNGHPR